MGRSLDVGAPVNLTAPLLPDSPPAEERGTCFGFRVRSPLSFEYLREGEGEPLEIFAASCSGPAAHDRLLLEWTPNPRRSFHARLYSDGHEYRFWSASSGWFSIDPTVPRIAVPEVDDATRREEHLWGIPTMLCFMHRDGLPIHAAAVDVNGSGLLFAAPGGSGKTTLAASFFQAGHRMLSEDYSYVRFAPFPSVVPGPAFLRLRRDVVDSLGFSLSRVVSESDDRLSIALPEGSRGNCQPVPLRAIVMLRTTEDRVKITRAHPAEAIPDLWALTFRVPGDRGLSKCFTGLVDVVRNIPVWNFYQAWRTADLPTAVELIRTTCLLDG